MIGAMLIDIIHHLKLFVEKDLGARTMRGIIARRCNAE